MSSNAQTFLPAVVPPWAAYVIARDYGRAIEQKAAEMRTAQPAVAEQLVLAVASMREAGRQRSEAHRQARNGRSEVPMRAHRPESVVAIGGHGATTGEAAMRLEVSERQVINLISSGALVAAKPKGRWVIDEVSLATEIESRGTG